MAKASHERRAAYQKDARRVAFCSECGNEIGGKNRNAKTCSSKCRSARSRRLQRQKRDARKMTPHQKEIAARIDGSIDDVTHKVVEEEIRPVVREALTQEIFNSIQQMTGLVPASIEALAADLASEDPKTRQKAYELVIRYTLGNTAVLKDDPERHQPLTVNFALPRPGQPEGPAEPAEITADAEEVRECDTCGSSKPASEFVENSFRCKSCFETYQKQLEELRGA